MLIQQRFYFFNEILDEMCSTNTQLARFVVMARNMSLIYLFARGQALLRLRNLPKLVLQIVTFHFLYSARSPESSQSAL